MESGPEKIKIPDDIPKEGKSLEELARDAELRLLNNQEMGDIKGGTRTLSNIEQAIREVQRTNDLTIRSVFKRITGQNNG